MPDPAIAPSPTGALGSEAQTQIRLARIEERIGALDRRMDHVIDLLEGRVRLTERCMTALTTIANGPNMRWIALIMLGLAAIANGMALSGYGVQLGAMADAMSGAVEQAHAQEAP